jgi:hypothetical protein
MTLSETGLILLVICGITGLIIVLTTPDPLTTVSVTGDEAEPSQLEVLQIICGELIYGNLPRETSSADTTILTMDLDCSLYTPVQANLHLTRAMRQVGIDHVLTLEKPDGGLTFLVNLENGEPLRLELKY